MVGLALAKYQGHRIAAVVLALILLHNTVYLWTKKRGQFVERAAPTEQLIDFARRTTGPIWVQCFPLAAITAEAAVGLAAGRSPSDLLWSAGEARERKAATFCYTNK